MDQIKSQLLDSIDSIKYGFGTSIHPKAPHQIESFESSALQWKQVHGSKLCFVEIPCQNYGEADGFYTDKPGICISVKTADCVPILIAAKNRPFVATIHAGWKGIYNEIIGALSTIIQKIDGMELDDLVAVIGPAICEKHYQVSPELFKSFKQRFGDVGEIANHIDLKTIASTQLRRIGISKVEILPLCTYHSLSEDNSYLFKSYRRGDRQSRQYSTIEINHN